MSTVSRKLRIATLAGLVATAPLVLAQSADSKPSSKPAASMHPDRNHQGATAKSKPRRTGDGLVTLNFQDADIQAVIKTVSKMTGTNFLLDPRVKGKITIISAKPVSRPDAYQIFLSALRAQGFTATPGPGGVVNVVPVGEGKQRASTNARVRAHAGDEMVTQVFSIQHGEASQLVPLLRPLMAPTSQIAAYAPANALIITDYAANVRRLRRIVSEVDQPENSETTIIPLKNASALDIADLLSRIESTGTSHVVRRPAGQGVLQQQGVVVVPDPRTNSLLVRTANPGQLMQIRSLVAKLDTSATPSGTTRVVYLQNANAKKLAEILRGLLDAKKVGKNAKASNVVPSTIQADEATNSLIISAPDAVYNNLRSVIDKLDIRRAQVYVEALITEVQVNKASELGFQWASGAPAGQGIAGGVVNFPQSNGTGLGQLAVNPAGLANASGLSLAYLGPQITLPDGSVVNSLAALARALEQENVANILSTPNLLTLDNAEAKIMVGQNVPFVTGSYAQATTGTTGAINPFQTIERKDIGLTLKIKPQISEGGTIKMDVSEEVSTLSPTAVAGATDLVTNKRQLKTKVIVDDGHTVVLGGLIEDNVQNTRQKVPILGSIPILGALFRYDSHKKVKTNLMIFLRPTIIRNAADSNRVTQDRYRRLLGRSGGILDDQRAMVEDFRPKPIIEGKDTTKTRSKDAGSENATSTPSSADSPAPTPKIVAPGSSTPAPDGKQPTSTPAQGN
jgi:general secretion pathway protein D